MSGTPLDERGLPLGYPFKDDWEITPREYRRRRDAGALASTVPRRPDGG